MRSTRKTLTHLFTVAASAVLMITALAAPSSAAPDHDAHAPAELTAAVPDDVPEIGDTFDPTAQMSSSRFCVLGWCFSGSSKPMSGHAWSKLERQDRSWDRYYSAWFHANGETLHVTDGYSDGYYARADVVVTDPDTRIVLDRDTLYTGTSRTFNLGTPDGSGDIAEGLDVSFRVCRGDGKPCSPWVTARS